MAVNTTMQGYASSDRPCGPPEKESLRLNLLALCCALCGAFARTKIVFVGELLVGEIALILLGLLVFLFRGSGRQIVPAFLAAVFAAGMMMLVGYALSDLVAGTGPGQYLRGWARVVFTLAFSLSFAIIASHGWRHVWWFIAGMTASNLGSVVLIQQSFGVNDWKFGYAAPIAFVVAMAAGYLPAGLSAMLFGLLGIINIVLDYRSLGGICLVITVMLALQSPALRRSAALRLGTLALAIPAVVMLGSWAYLQGDKETMARRAESNVGRSVTMQVAIDAIRDQPLIGFGSWASDKEYSARLRRAMTKALAGTDMEGDLGAVILPHSQILAAWIEGGILGAGFFMFLTWQLASGLKSLAQGRTAGTMVPVALLVLLFGFWDVFASPFAGVHRISIALCVAVLSLIAFDRQQAALVRRAGYSGGQGAAARARR